MFDTVNFRLWQSEVKGVDFISETPCYLENVGEHYWGNELSITGNIGNLKVSINRNQVKIKDGSLCKWYFGNNFQTMTRRDTKEALEKLSDALHLPINKASITRLDIATNFIVKQPTEVYFNHLGTLAHTQRYKHNNGVYYHGRDKVICLYDKIEEAKAHSEPTPDLYKGKNVLRYEQRYLHRIANALQVEAVNGALLYDEAFYSGLLQRWKQTYLNIQKLNDITLNFEAMRSKKELYQMGVLSLVNMVGGQTNMIEQINTASKNGILTRKQALDLRKAVNEVCTLEELTVKNTAISELDNKVIEAVRFYR